MRNTHPILLFAAACALGCEASKPAADTAPAEHTATAREPEPAADTAPTANTAPAASELAEPAKPPEAVAAQHVLIAYRGAKNAPKEVKRSKGAAKQLAAEVLAKARSGGDFTALVKEYSEDPGTKERLGSVGKFTPDKMVKPFSEAAFKLDVNEISEIVETEFGFHIIKRNQ